MTATVLRGDAHRLPLADDSVDLVISSPPYFALRSYQDGGEHYAGQIGSEATPAEFVDSLLEVTRECVRVLKPSGSLWINLGDKYSSGSGGDSNLTALGQRLGTGGGQKQDSAKLRSRPAVGFRPKTLLGIPWRYALRCIDDLGLILRAEVIWSKPNGLPESVTDRVRRSHEQWFWFQQQSDDDVVVPGPKGFPFCSLCGRPADPRTSLIARLHELETSVENTGLTHEIRPNERVQGERGGSAQEEREVSSISSPVPLAVPLDRHPIENTGYPLDDGHIAAVDQQAQMRAPGTAVAEGNGTLSVDDAGKPSVTCECIGHSLILNDEPWIPQSLAAEIAQLVADGKVDPQQAADFLAGDYVRTHSVWFHFVLQPRYYSAVDEIREAHQSPSTMLGRRAGATFGTHTTRTHTADGSRHTDGHPLGKLPSSVWTIPTEPLTVPDHLGVDHFAAFPLEWPRRIIAGWSPPGVCTECGEGRRPVVQRGEIDPDLLARRGGHAKQDYSFTVHHGGDPAKRGIGLNISGTEHREHTSPTTITGYACACPEPTAPTAPARVLDPFGGTGTTALAAKALGRHGITIDMSADYSRLARWRTTDERELAKAMRVDKPAIQVDGQGSLLDLIQEA